MTDVLTAHEGGHGAAGPLRVTIVAASPDQHQRLADLLAPIEEIEVAGWTECPQQLALIGECAEVGLVLTAPRAIPAAPRLAARQRDVLVAYAASNDLVDVVARRLGMNPETFKTHLRRIRVKYEEASRPAPTRRDLYVRAVEDGFIAPPS